MTATDAAVRADGESLKSHSEFTANGVASQISEIHKR
jgi:hypothetical protein